MAPQLAPAGIAVMLPLPVPPPVAVINVIIEPVLVVVGVPPFALFVPFAPVLLDVPLLFALELFWPAGLFCVVCVLPVGF